MHVLSAILQRATEQPALEFAQENLFTPLGIQDVIWPSDARAPPTGEAISICSPGTRRSWATCG